MDLVSQAPKVSDAHESCTGRRQNTDYRLPSNSWGLDFRGVTCDALSHGLRVDGWGYWKPGRMWCGEGGKGKGIRVSAVAVNRRVTPASGALATRRPQAKRDDGFSNRLALSYPLEVCDLPYLIPTLSAYSAFRLRGIASASTPLIGCRRASLAAGYLPASLQNPREQASHLESLVPYTCKA